MNPKTLLVSNLHHQPDPTRNLQGHVLSKYSGRPNRSFRTHFLVFWRVDISLKPSASSDTRRDATNSLKLVTVRNLTPSRKTFRKDTTRMNALSYAKVAKEGVDCDCGARIVMASPTRWARGTARIGGGAIMAASGSAAMADVEAARRGEGSGGLD